MEECHNVGKGRLDVLGHAARLEPIVEHARLIEGAPTGCKIFQETIAIEIVGHCVAAGQSRKAESGGSENSRAVACEKCTLNI